MKNNIKLKLILAIFLAGVWAGFLKSDVLADSSCAKPNVRWASSSNTIYISNGAICSFSEIKTAGIPDAALSLADSANKIWFVSANILIQNGSTLKITGSAAGGDANEVRLKSGRRRRDYVTVRASWGNIEIGNTKITSWDASANGPDMEYRRSRAFIGVRSLGASMQSRMDIRNSEIAYLGFYDSESYGLTWKVTGGDFNNVGVYGEVVNNKIHHNYFGIYTYGAEGMRFLNNEVYSNIMYGIDPHDDSDNIVIDSNDVHDNGYHGIICSKRCDNISITNNTSSNNGGHGIMIHSQVTNSLVENNQTNGNAIAGIALFDSHYNRILNNTAQSNAVGVRLSVGSSNNTISGNILSGNSYGIYTYKGSDRPASGDGRIKLNLFENNKILASSIFAIRLSESDNNTFRNNELTGNTRDISVSKGSKGNIFD